MAVGVTHAPVCIVKDLNKLDEIRFNQLHNGTDLDTGDENVRVPASSQVGYVDVPHTLVKGNLKAKGKGLRAAIIELITGYGPWGGVVASAEGRTRSHVGGSDAIDRSSAPATSPHRVRIAS